MNKLVSNNPNFNIPKQTGKTNRIHQFLQKEWELLKLREKNIAAVGLDHHIILGKHNIWIAFNRIQFLRFRVFCLSLK